MKLPPSTIWNKHIQHLTVQPYRSARSFTKRAVPDNANGAHINNTEVPQPSQEKTLNLSDFLRECPDDFLFKDIEEAETNTWDHEDRFVREPPTSIDETAPQVKGALDPAQADILSAYSAEQGFQEIDVQALKEDRAGDPKLKVLDVRTPEEYSQGHVPGAIHLELSKLNASALEQVGIEKDQKVYVVCASGKRSAQACVRMSKVFGYSECVNVKGGTNAWIAAGEQTEN